MNATGRLREDQIAHMREDLRRIASDLGGVQMSLSALEAKLQQVVQALADIAMRLPPPDDGK